MLLVSQQQPWHPAWSRQWIPQNNMQNDVGPLKKPQTVGNDQHVTPLTPNIKTGGMWFTFPQLAGGASVTFLNPSLDLSIAAERDSPSPWQTNCKTKNWMAQRMEATATTHIGGSIFSEVGGKTNVLNALKTKEGDSVHSTFSTNKDRKRGGGPCQQSSLGVNDDHYITSFHSFLLARLLRECDSGLDQ